VQLDNYNPKYLPIFSRGPNGKLKVEQRGEECGFGHNVRAEGTFRKISNRKPKFDDA
jgi:hypothetical protein